MGKDTDACCDACRLFADPCAQRAEVVPPPVLHPSRCGVTIEVFEGNRPIATLSATAARVTVGRVAGNDIVLANGTISKRQCELRIDDDGITLVDLKSNCGTYIDGRKITSPTRLHAGATIYAGNFRLRVVTR